MQNILIVNIVKSSSEDCLLSPVFNASLYGVIMESLNHEIEEIYGSQVGFNGLMSNQLINLSDQSKQTIESLLYTPNPVLGLGVCLQPEDCSQIVQKLESENIGFVVCIGDQEAQRTVKLLSEYIKSQEKTIKVLGIPQSASNEISGTDYSPGYPSISKYLVNLITEIELRSQNVHVNILEIPGKSSGWLALSCTLARNKKDKRSLLTYIPEVPVQTNDFVNQVSEAVKEFGQIAIVASEGIVDENGNRFSQNENNISVKDQLAEVLRKAGMQVATYRVDFKSIAMASYISLEDSKNAILSGEFAVDSFMNSKESGKMIGFLREYVESRKLEVKLVDIETVLESKPKLVPSDWMEEGVYPRFQFSKYLASLIEGEIKVVCEHGIPKFAKLKNNTF